MSALPEAFNEATPLNPELIDAAAAAARTLARYSSAPTVRLAVGDGEASPISLPADIFAQIVDLLSKIANGNAVSIVPIDAELTTQQAADLMNVSRPHVIKLIERGDLPHRMVGTHRKLPARSVLAFRHKTELEQVEALRRMAALDSELGIDDDEPIDNEYTRPS